MQFIDLKEQYSRYKSEIDARIATVLGHGQYVMGAEIAEIEKVLADFVGTKHCITVSSGTHSLEIALRALGVSEGDEVITVPFTWISSAEVVLLVGARPVFVDIEKASYNLDTNLLERAITRHTKAIIPVSLFGQVCNIEAVNDIAEKHGIPVIEDAAQSFGASRNGRFSGGLSKIGSTSFFPAKPLGCYGDGGAIFTSDDILADKMRAVRNHGGLVRHEHYMVGTNGRFDTIQAAVLLAKMPHFSDEIAARSRIGARYSELLKDVAIVPEVMPGNIHVYAQYTIRLKNRDEVAAALKAKGIPTAMYYPKCLHEQPVFAPFGYKWGDFPVAEKASREVLSLPMHPFLSEADQNAIVSAVKEVAKRPDAQ
jgi:UDP-2-acetamido-2-deoxy-ribo-hexuluronate aminotransferase